ncbi:MAG: hypothetical protein KAI24_10580, partial [Planctomycetes bacterium]|nr:hypothetical protein [Planctomycetota bacterium]
QVAASATAHPAVFAAAVALVAGVLAMRGWRWSSYLAVAVAGGCHPLGWLAGAGLVAATRAPGPAGRVPGWAFALLVVPALPLVPDLVLGPAVAAVLLAAAAFALRLPGPRGFAAALLLPLAAAGGWWWQDPGVGASARVVSAPIVCLLAAWAAVQFARVVGEQLAQPRAVARLVGVAVAVMMIGELLTATFLYFAVYRGGRPAWRQARAAVSATRVAGRELQVVAGRGVDVLRAYLRPDHWHEPQRDPHPGVRVEALAPDEAGRAAQVAAPGALFVLQADERAALGAAADGFVVLDLWPCPTPVGDGSLYVLRRRAPD